MPPADHKNFEKKCATCLAVLHSNTVSVRYNVCKKYFHQKCSTGPRALTRDNLWNCDKCSKLQQNLSTTSTNCQVPGPTNSTPSQPLPLAVCNKLKVYQWNADGIRPKFLELRDQLINFDIDILSIQESKLRKAEKTPFIEGYPTVRKDRNNILGGGLLLFIRIETISVKLHSFEKAGMEILFICLKTTLLELYDVYLPNNSTQYNLFDPSLIKPGPSSLILGDLNGHSQMWDTLQPQDQHDDEILDWILDNNLHILNYGSATQTSQITSNDSTPNIYLCGSNWKAKTSWRLAELFGSSDHLPILIKINHKIRQQPVVPRAARYRRKNVN